MKTKCQNGSTESQARLKEEERSLQAKSARRLKLPPCSLALTWFLVLLSWNFPAAAAPPALTADKAAKIAQEQLTSRNLQGRHHISSLVLEKSSIASKEVRWVAIFTPSIPLGGRKEIGAEIGMDGSVVRLVNKAAKP